MVGLRALLGAALMLTFQGMTQGVTVAPPQAGSKKVEPESRPVVYAWAGLPIPIISTYWLECKNSYEQCFFVYTCCNPNFECISSRGGPYRCLSKSSYVPLSDPTPTETTEEQ